LNKKISKIEDFFTKFDRVFLNNISLKNI